MKLIKTILPIFAVILLSGCNVEKTATVSETPTVSSTMTHEVPQTMASSRFIEGVHYIKKKHLPRSIEPQIIKFVSYNCPACRFFESTSKLSLDENVVIERFPVSFSREEWRDSARAYATLRSLNIHNELSDQLFQSVQDLRIPIGNEQDFVAWLSKRTRLSESTILEAYNHDKVDELMAMYKAAERRYAITSVPSIYVNGNIQVKLKALEGETQLDKMIFLNSLIDHLLLLKH